MPGAGVALTFGTGDENSGLQISGMDVAIGGRASVSSHTRRKSANGASVDNGVGTNCGWGRSATNSAAIRRWRLSALP